MTLRTKTRTMTATTKLHSSRRFGGGLFSPPLFRGGRSMKTLLWPLCAIAIGPLARPAQAQDQWSGKAAERRQATDRSGPDWRLYLSSGASFVTRDRDDLGRTNYYRIPLGARLSKGRFRLSATIPYVVVRGPGSLIGDGDEIDDIPAADDRKRSGLGDLRLTARYRLLKSALGGFELDLMGRVKVPTASRKERLGTGEVDYALGAEVSRDVGQFEPFVSAQYRLNGDRPDFDYRNTVATSVGTGVRLNRRTRASFSYDYLQSRIRGNSGFHSLDAGVSTRLSSRASWSTSGSVGLSKRAPDFGVRSTITWRAF